MSICSTCNKNIGEQMLMCPYCGAHNQSADRRIVEYQERLSPRSVFFTFIIVFTLQAVGAGVLFLFSFFAVGGDGSAGGFYFVNFINFLIIFFTGITAWRSISKNHFFTAVAISFAVAPIGLFVYFLLGMLVYALRSIGFNIG